MDFSFETIRHLFLNFATTKKRFLLGCFRKSEAHLNLLGLWIYYDHFLFQGSKGLWHSRIACGCNKTIFFSRAFVRSFSIFLHFDCLNFFLFTKFLWHKQSRHVQVINFGTSAECLFKKKNRAALFKKGCKTCNQYLKSADKMANNWLTNFQVIFMREFSSYRQNEIMHIKNFMVFILFWICMFFTQVN